MTGRSPAPGRFEERNPPLVNVHTAPRKERTDSPNLPCVPSRNPARRHESHAGILRQNVPDMLVAAFRSSHDPGDELRILLFRRPIGIEAIVYDGQDPAKRPFPGNLLKFRRPPENPK